MQPLETATLVPQILAPKNPTPWFGHFVFKCPDNCFKILAIASLISTIACFAIGMSCLFTVKSDVGKTFNIFGVFLGVMTIASFGAHLQVTK